MFPSFSRGVLNQRSGDESLSVRVPPLPLMADHEVCLSAFSIPDSVNQSFLLWCPADKHTGPRGELNVRLLRLLNGKAASQVRRRPSNLARLVAADSVTELAVGICGATVSRCRLERMESCLFVIMCNSSPPDTEAPIVCFHHSCLLTERLQPPPLTRPPSFLSVLSSL